MDSVLELLLDHGSLGLFAAFLIWLYASMQKRMDSLVDKFQSQLESIQEKAEANEEKLRGRYDTVIKQYQDDKTTFRVNVAGKVSEAIRKIDGIEKGMDGLPFETILIQIEALSMAHRNSQIILEKGMDIMKDMQEDARLKEMARKLTQDKDNT